MKIKKFLTIGVVALAASASFNAQAEKLDNTKKEIVENDTDSSTFNGNSRTSSLIRVGLSLLSITSGKPAPIELSDISNIFTGSKSEEENIKKTDSEEKNFEVKNNAATVVSKLRENNQVNNSPSLKLN